MKRGLKKTAETVFGVVGGNAILALAVAAFILPRGTIMGGATGIGLTINNYFPINLSIVIFIVNACLFILGAAVLGKKFALTTIASTFLYPFFLSLIQRIPNIDNLTNSEFLSIIYGGVFLGAGIGMIVRVGSSTGGTDIVALVVNKWTHLSVAMLVYIVDFIVLACQMAFSSPEQVLYGVLNLVISTMVLNRVMLLGKSQIQIFVVSDAYEEIRTKLLKEANVGATMLHIETGYGNEEKKGVLCVISNRKLYTANELIHEVDPKAFVTISQINEVKGRGFSMDRVDYSEINKREK
ncbi:MAG: YitT family protein [Suipraeoptans sp.]